MGKSKKSKSKSDKLYTKRSKPEEKKLNPFELHINKEKHAILNKQLKNHRGNPGKNRDQAFKMRQETIGQEYLGKYKQNTLVDRRSDGYEMSGRQHKRTAIYNLNDEEVLTHKGQTLREIERYDTVDADHDDDSEDERLDAEFTEAAHFGGTGTETRDRKSVIDELIAESKRRKSEKIKENEQMFEITQALDENWKNLVPLVGPLIKRDEIREKPDEYDRTMRELIFERRGAPTNPLKTKEEEEKLEREKIRKLELERERRMQDQDDVNNVPKHKSADDLDDGYFAEEITEENERMVAYEINARDAGIENDNEKEEIESENENEEKDQESSDEEEQGEEQEHEDSEEESEADNLSDLKESDSESEDEEEKIDQETDSSTSQKEEIPKIDPSINQQKVPGNYYTFCGILKNRSPKEIGLIIAAMIRNNNIFVVHERKDKLLALFAFILQKINDLFSTGLTSETISDHFKILNQLVPQLYTLTQQHPVETSLCLKEVLKEKQETYKKRHKFYPHLDTIVFFKIISVLYSTSDFRHPIVTPAVVFLSQIMTRSRVNGRRDVSTGLLLATIHLEYTQLSKRVLPAVFNFLNGIFYLSIKKRDINEIQIVPPFRQGSNLLATEKCLESFETSLKMTACDLISNDLDEEFKLRALYTALGLLIEYLKIQEESPGLHYFVRNSLSYIEKLDKALYPETISNKIDETMTLLKKYLEIKVQYLVEKEKKPKILRQIDPKIEKVFDGSRKHKVTSKVKAEREKLLHKFKREKKGAIREIRRDNEYLRKLKLKQQIQSDRIRQDKVKRIYSEAFAQQGEFKAMERKKKR